MLDRILKTKMLYITSGLATLVGTILISVFSNILTEYVPHALPEKEPEIAFKGLHVPFNNLVSKRINEAIDTYKENDHKKALVHLNSILATLDNPRSHTTKNQKAFVQSIMATCYFEMGQYKKAIKLLNQSISLSPTSYSHKLLADIYFHLLSKTKSKTKAKKYLKMYKKHSDDAYMLKVSKSSTLPLNTLKQRFYSIASQAVISSKAANDAILRESKLNSVLSNDVGVNISIDTFINNPYNSYSLDYEDVSKDYYFWKSNNISDDSRTSKPKAYLVSIGVNNYLGEEINSLNYAEKDSSDIVDSFVGIYGSRLAYYNLVGQKATRENILSTLHKVRDLANSMDNVFIYYSGHGYSNDVTSISGEKTRNSYMLTVSSTLGDISSTSISIRDIKKIFSGNKLIKPLVIMDSCNDLVLNSTSLPQFVKYKSLLNSKVSKNTFNTRSSIVRFNNNRKENGKIFVISSSSIGELSAESNKLKNGVFTHYLVKAINSRINTKEKDKSVINLNTLLPIVQKKVNKYLQRLKLHQKISVSFY